MGLLGESLLLSCLQLTPLMVPLYLMRVSPVWCQNLAVFGTCNPYVLVKLKSSLDSLTTGVKVRYKFYFHQRAAIDLAWEGATRQRSLM